MFDCLWHKFIYSYKKGPGCVSFFNIWAVQKANRFILSDESVFHSHTHNIWLKLKYEVGRYFEICKQDVVVYVAIKKLRNAENSSS